MFSFGGYLYRGIVNFQVTRRLPYFLVSRSLVFQGREPLLLR